MRITAKLLRERMRDVNRLLDRPEQMFLDRCGTPDCNWAIGHLALDHNANGYQIEETVSDMGAVHNITNRLTGKEMDCYISGLLAGIALRNKNDSNN